MKLKNEPLRLLSLRLPTIAFLSVLLYACGGGGNGGSEDIGTGADGGDGGPPGNVDPQPQASRGRALLEGPLSEAEIKVYALSDRQTQIYQTTTDDDGYFTPTLSGIDDSTLLLVEVSGGEDTGVDNNEPIANLGTINALTTVQRFNAGDFQITALSDIAWRYSNELLDQLHPSDVQRRLDNLANILIAEDINGDSVIDAEDLISFSPLRQDHQLKLAFYYQTLFQAGNNGVTVIDAYHSGESAQLKNRLASLFGQRLSFNPPLSSDFQKIKVTVKNFGQGKITGNRGRIDVDTDRTPAENIRFDYFDKSLNETLILTAAPKPDTEFIGWTGCDNVVNNQAECTVNFDSNRTVIANFKYKDAQTVDNWFDLSAASATVDGDIVRVTVDTTATALIADLSNIQVADFIVGLADGIGYLKQVTEIVKSSDTDYRFTTKNATITDVVKQGTGVFTKTMDGHDLDQTTQSAQSASRAARPYSVAANQTAFFRGVEGANLVLSKDSKRFRIELGKPLDDLAQPALDATFDQTVVLVSQNGEPAVTASGSLELDVSLDVGIDVSLFGGLEYFKFVPEVNIENNIRVDVEQSIGGFDQSFKLATLNFGSDRNFVFTIGFLPVYIDLQVDLIVGANGDVNAIVSTGVTTAAGGKAGFIYDEDTGFESVADISGPDFNFQAPDSLEIPYTLEAYIGPITSFNIYGQTGPAVPLRGYVRLENLVEVSPWLDGCKTSISFLPSVGFSAGVAWNVVDNSILGSLLPSVVTDFLTNREVSLFNVNVPLTQFARTITPNCSDSQTPILNVIGSGIRQTVTAGQSIRRNYTLTNEGDAPLTWSANVNQETFTTLSQTGGDLATGAITEVQISIDTTGLSAGTYRDRIQFINESVNTAASDRDAGNTELPVIINVLSPTQDFPGPVLDSAILVSPLVVRVEWHYPDIDTFNNIAGYNIYALDNQGNEKRVAVIAGASQTSVLITEIDNAPLLADTTYTFVMEAFGGDSTSARSEAISVTTGIPDQDSHDYAFFDDFNDNDYTSNPVWKLQNADVCPGLVNVDDGYVRLLRSNAEHNDGRVGINSAVNIEVTANTAIGFDALVNSRSIHGGCGEKCNKYPINVVLSVEDSQGEEKSIQYALNYGEAAKDKTGENFKRLTIALTQGVWEKDLRFNLRDAWPEAVKITNVYIYGEGWDFDGGIDNIWIE